MYNMKLKDYTLSAAREMIHLDQENLADDLNHGYHSWLGFIDNSSLTFFLIGEGLVSSKATIDKVISDQFGRMKIDLAIAYALSVKLDSGDQDTDTPEDSEASEMLWHVLRRIGAVEPFPSYGVTDTEKQNQLFRIYQIRRRIRYAFWRLKSDVAANRFLDSSIEAIFDEILDMEDYTIHISPFLIVREAHAAINYWLRCLEENGEAGPGCYLRNTLYMQNVIPDPFLYNRYFDGYDD